MYGWTLIREKNYIIRNYKSQDFHSNFLFIIYWRSTSRKHIFYLMKIQLFCCISISWIVYNFQSQTLICAKYPGSISYQLKLISHDTRVLLTHFARKCNVFSFSTILPTADVNYQPNTVKPVLRDHCHETTCLETPHIPSRRSYILMEVNLSLKNARLERPHFYWQWGGLTRLVLLYTTGTSASLAHIQYCWPKVI